MENLKLGLIFLSVILNFYLITELKKQNTAHMISIETLGSRLQSMGSSAATGPDKSISNAALMDMVNNAVHDEFSRNRPSSANTAGVDAQRLDQFQARLEALQNMVADKAAGGGGKEKKLKEEAQKLKQEILAQCVRK